MTETNPPISPQIKKKVLHVGCSNKAIMEKFAGPEWQEVRLDIDPNAKPDIVASMVDLHMIADNEFDAIWSAQNIEHLYAHEVTMALKEFYRVLKNGGGLFATTPDLQTICEYVVKGNLEGFLYQSNSGPISPIDSIYGYRASMAKGNLFMAHRMGFTVHTMANHLKTAGFSEIHVRRTDYDLAASAFKKLEIPPEQTKIHIIDKDYNRIMINRDNIDKEPELKEGWQLNRAPVEI